jgi:hypothetical protein
MAEPDGFAAAPAAHATHNAAHAIKRKPGSDRYQQPSVGQTARPGCTRDGGGSGWVLLFGGGSVDQLVVAVYPLQTKVDRCFCLQLALFIYKFGGV